ncbi:odorant receptor 46a-like isoform X1 [Camponotus floridanus]|uniref:odorant receptor 46a-like isoform X1 n=1 Tax=Camponotus floridanus TaxID=104421 RepID=UPI000DC6B14B|nr:odorant receptor 46a-like isoform X1 [Camponotus floridanus]
MQILSLNFFMNTIAGIWRPIDWSSNTAKLLYNAFTFIVLILEYFLMLTQFMDIVLVVDNIDDFATNTLMFLTIVAICCKATVIIIRRNSIIRLVQKLLKAPYKPQDEDEMAVQTKCDKFIKSWSIKYIVLVIGSVTGITIGSVLNMMQGHLPYRVWLPYDTNVSLIFWITSIQQIVSIIFGAIINVGTETLIFGLSLQTCAQFEIYELRLRKLVTSKITNYLNHLPASSKIRKVAISEYIHHHLCIYRFAKTINMIFNQVFFIQFFGSILILCTSVYYVSTHMMESESATLIIYTFCMFVQIYLFCWSGNEVILKSMNLRDAIYHTEWFLLSISDKKELIMIMMRSTIPVKFTSSFLITLSLQSFSSILKTSYSAFNLLQK